MLNFLTPPTDNVYKFIGIGGLVIFITCAIFLFSGMYKDDYKLVLAKGEIDIQESRLRTLVDDLENLPQYKKLPDVKLPILRAWAYQLTDINRSKDPLFMESFYALPDSMRKKMESILFVRLEKQIKYNALNQKINTAKRNENIIFACSIIGEIVGILGILFWYHNLQKPIDDERKKQETQKRFTGTDFSTNCHSCYMTFYFNSERGTEKDGSINRFFCVNCYDQGGYVEPELTFEEAKKRLIVKLQELNYNELRIKKIEKQLGKLLRWERLKNW